MGQCNCEASVSISFSDYQNRVLGAWIGKSLGGIIGAPFEAHKMFGTLTAEECWPSKIYPNDDLDIQVVWLEMLQDCGPTFSSDDLVEYWQDRCWYNFAEYGSFLYNVQRGIAPPLSGSFNNEYFSESMGAPIRAEIWGLISPGNAFLAAKYAEMDGQLDHKEFSVQTEMFWAAAISQAITSGDIEEALMAGIAMTPAESRIHEIFDDVDTLYDQLGEHSYIWRELIKKYGSRDSSKAEINFAFTLLALFLGDGDFKKTIVAALNCGWDTDCTAATVGALLGAVDGVDGIPADWMKKMGDRLTCDVNVKHKTSLFTELAEDTCKVGLEASLTVNDLLEITDVPKDILKDVMAKIESRVEDYPVTIEAIYPDFPVLSMLESTKVILKIDNNSYDMHSGYLTISPPTGITVSPERLKMTLLYGDTQNVELSVCSDYSEDIIWDANRIVAMWEDDDESKSVRMFGLVGSRQWLVYGPYWDAWDKSKSEECPFRNAETITHPVHVEDRKSAMYHQYYDINREYLDEKTLMQEEVIDELPLMLQKCEDSLDHNDIGGFGESCYYLTRTIVSRYPVDAAVSFGSTGPFVVWLDGKEVLRVEKSSAWYPFDYSFTANFDSTPKRLVIKCIRPSDEWKFSMCFVKTDIPGDKINGVSCLLDSFGDTIWDMD